MLERPVRTRSIPRDQWTATLVAYAMQPGTTGLFEEMEDTFNLGWIDFEVPGTETVAGEVTPTQVFEQLRKARDGV